MRLHLNKLGLTALAIAASVTHWQPPAAAGAAQAQDVQTFTAESRKVAAQVVQALNTQLIREMQLSGPLRSMIVCKLSCPEILSSQSRKTGWRVTAVSLKPRNSAVGMPDAWEQRVIMQLSQRAAAGTDSGALEFAEVVQEPQASYFRYAKAIMVEPLCVACHGARDQLSEPVRAQLAIDYPFDKAVDFKVGEVYGIVSVKRDAGVARDTPTSPPRGFRAEQRPQ